SVRIDTLKLDNLVDMVGELVIAQSMVLQNPDVLRIKDQKLQKDSVQLTRITAELQRISMSMRMVPIKSTFQKMIRLVRDLAKKSGKEVSLEMKGEETEIDRNMVEEIYEPLVHMIRNSVDHGLETPEERKKAGKHPSGTILIAAEQKGGNIVIDIHDDGRGLDAQKIRAKGIERGIIAADDVLDEKAIYELILHPGFSTKDTVTEVSGRGVGMDVVKKSVENLRGKMEINSAAGKGTQIQLKLPLTMAIIDGMIVRVGDERYVVPTIAMKESLRPARETYLTVQGRGEMIKVRNSLMPLVRLHKILQVEPRFHNPWEALLLVVSEGKHSYCLLADEIVGRQEVVIKSLGGSLRQLVGISGGAILGDGKVALIIDVKGVVSLYEDNSK
ncbi:MAG: chemotaxis protein CheA, partial [Desulfobacteraceae bacterium]|nr:chemotaxis protein CheA [Desulfobacteraceae bacterium]